MVTEKDSLLDASSERHWLFTALVCSACARGDVKALENALHGRWALLSELSDYDMRTPLHVAVDNGNVDMAIAILDRGNVDPNVRDRWLTTPLWSAIRNGDASMTKALASRGALVRQSDTVVSTLLCAIAGARDTSKLHVISNAVVNGGVSIDVKDYDMRTPLHVAAETPFPEAVDMLLKNGASQNVRDRWGQTPSI